MVKYKNFIFNDYDIDDDGNFYVKGKLKTYKRDRPAPILRNENIRIRASLYEIQMHTKVGYRPGMIIHHIDGNKENNSLQNLEYITRSEHAIHHKSGSHHTEKTKLKMRCSHLGKHSGPRRPLNEEEKLKRSIANKDLIWISNGKVSKRIHKNDSIPNGFVRGRLNLNK